MSAGMSTIMRNNVSSPSPGAIPRSLAPCPEANPRGRARENAHGRRPCATNWLWGLFALALTSCAHSGRSVVPPMTDAPSAATPRKSVRPAKPPHGDYGQLRPFRNYYRIIHVGEYAHRFEVFYDTFESVHAHYSVVVEPTGQPRVRYEGRGLGLGNRVPRDWYPALLATMVEAIRQEVWTREKFSTWRWSAEGSLPGMYWPLASYSPWSWAWSNKQYWNPERPITLFYRGAYRRVVIEEIVPLGEPGEPSLRLSASRVRVLAADASLSRLVGPGEWGEVSNRRVLCAPDGGMKDCAPSPFWIDARLDRQGIPRLHDDDSLSAEVWEGFVQAVLAAARHYAAGEPGPPLGELSVHKDDAPR